MRLAPLAIPVLCTVWTGALAQTQDLVVPTTCLFVGESYSPGATIRAGNQVMECTGESTWALTESWAAGCFFSGEFFSVGSVNKGSAKGDVRTICIEDGTWQLLDLSGDAAVGCFSKDDFYSPGAVIDGETKIRCGERGIWVEEN